MTKEGLHIRKTDGTIDRTIDNTSSHPAPSPGPALQNPDSQASFESFSLRPETLRAIRRLGWQVPTPIQAEVIPVMRRGADLVGQAQTGSGKTGAFGIPIVDRADVSDAGVNGHRAGAPEALVLTPTRELAVQVTGDLNALGRGRGVRAVAVYGGHSIIRQIEDLRGLPEIVVATPGRLLDHLDRGTIRLDSVRVAVLDEGDRMLDMGFLPDVSRILRRTPASRQTALFSATMPPAIHEIARRQMRDPVWLRIASAAPTVDTVEQFYLEVAEQDKARALRALLADPEITSALVFRRTRHRVDRLARAVPGATVLHGGMMEGARMRALRAFEQNRSRVLIATNVASRGLDLPAVSHVINFDVPEDVETYVHRIGRTARAGRAGTAITFVGQYDLEMFDQLRTAIGPALRRHPLNLYERRPAASS
ncbi:MAG TPA: DEAD/DEAH box helicase [bacterium]|nr:DEAD/DEAH box helicase [bacterium]